MRTTEIFDVNKQLKIEITKRILIEESLRKSEKNYRLITESTTDLIAITTFSLKPVFTFVSPSHKTVMGYEPADLVGKSGLKFIHPEDRNGFDSVSSQFPGDMNRCQCFVNRIQRSRKNSNLLPGQNRNSIGFFQFPDIVQGF